MTVGLQRQCTVLGDCDDTLQYTCICVGTSHRFTALTCVGIAAVAVVAATATPET